GAFSNPRGAPDLSGGPGRPAESEGLFSSSRSSLPTRGRNGRPRESEPMAGVASAGEQKPPAWGASSRTIPLSRDPCTLPPPPPRPPPLPPPPPSGPCARPCDCNSLFDSRPFPAVFTAALAALLLRSRHHVELACAG